MNEESLQHLSLDELYRVLINTVDEYPGVVQIKENRKNSELHQAELSIIHKAITRKKAEDLLPAK